MILAAHYGTIEDIEVVWTLIALIGLVFSLHNFLEVRKDIKVLNSLNIQNGRRAIAKVSYKSELTRAVKQIIFLIIGIFALYLPGGNYSHLTIFMTIVNIVFRWGLIISSALTTYQSYLAYDLRRTLMGQDS